MERLIHNINILQVLFCPNLRPKVFLNVLPESPNMLPEAIVVLSGKRKSGKDFVADKMVEHLGKDKCCIIRLSSPIKTHFAEKYNMSIQDLLSSSSQKETIRKEMIIWGEEKRSKDNGFFCRQIIEDAKTKKKSIWIVSDARRQTDVDFFMNYCSENGCSCYRLRIHADDETRQSRGWIFTTGVDDAESECGLDSFDDWTQILDNSMNVDIIRQLQTFCERLAK